MSSNDEAKLPKGWSRTFSKSQKRYYFSHNETKHTQWHFPTASEVADPAMAKKRAAENQERERKRSREKPAGEPQSAKKAKPAPAPAPDTAALALADTTSVAIIVPYRDLHAAQHRAEHLKKFVPHMIQFLSDLVRAGKVSDFHIYIVEQSDDGRKFNRGKLLNIGFDMARKNRRYKHDVFIFHDVDLLPQKDLSDAYARFPKAPYHIARVWDRYSNNPKYFGGVVSMSCSDYRRINGYPNTFWGWGGEDDELQNRCQTIGLSWEFPSKGTLVDLEQMNLKEKLDLLRQNKKWKCMVKWEALDEHKTTWKTNGLADLQYKVLQTVSLDPKTSSNSNSRASKITVDVKLNGNHWANDKCGVEFLGDWNNKK